MTLDRHESALGSATLMLTAAGIAMLSVALGIAFWRLRYGRLHQQLISTSSQLNRTINGIKDGELFTQPSGSAELDTLQQQINALVASYEKRLTVKQFEVSALEQENREIRGGQAEAALNLPVVDPQAPGASPHWFAALYRLIYHSLQSQLGRMEGAAGKDAQALDTMNDALNRLNQTLAEVKSLADLSLEPSDLQPEYISLWQLTASVMQLSAPQAFDKGIEVLLCQPNKPVDVCIDIGLMQKTLLTLLGSAIDMTDTGYVKLAVEVREHDEQHCLCCSVLYVGQGLEPAQFALLDEELVTEHLTGQAWLSTGLPLLVAKKTIIGAGGRFKLKNLVGLGCEFSLEIPCQSRDAEVEEPAAYNGCNALIYEPIVANGELIGAKLNELGINTTVCADPQEFMALLGENCADCVLVSRPVHANAQTAFDPFLASLLKEEQMPPGLLLTRDANALQLPDGWCSADKPFVLTDFLAAFSPGQLQASRAEVMTASSEREVTILAVDDNETNLRLLSVVLADLPVRLVLAGSGMKALQLAQAQEFDLVLMDKEMPEMDGLQTSIKMRQLVHHQQTPIVAFSAHVSDEDKRVLCSQGINECMEKPLDQAKFDYLMEKFCAQRWQQSVKGCTQAGSN